MEMKKQAKEKDKSNFLGEIFKGFIESFFGGQMPKRQQKRKPEEMKEPSEAKEKEAAPSPAMVSTTYIIINRERERKGFFKWVLGLFW
jgi:hypothetical protein